jgi:branched-chain amino acid transport system substrate-binding protein
MMRAATRFPILFIAGLGVLLAAASAARGEVLIGLASPLTGPMAWAGASNQLGAESAVADLNAHGGVLGERLELLAVDDFCDPDQALVAAEKLVAAGVPLVIGHHCSHPTLPASKVYAAAGVLMITPFTTNPKLTEQGFPTVFRMCGRDDRQGQVAGAFLAERFGNERIAIVHDRTVYGQSLAGETRRRLNELGVAEVLFEGVQFGQVDFSGIIQKMQALDVQVLYYAGLRHEAGLVVRQAYDQGYRPQVVAGDGVGGEEFALIAGPAADGTLMTYLASPPATAENALLVERFAAKGYGGSFGLGTFRSYAVVQAWAQAVEHAGSFTPGPVAEALRSFQFDTVVGRIGFDDKGDVTGFGTYVWYVWKGGEFAPLEEPAAAD